MFQDVLFLMQGELKNKNHAVTFLPHFTIYTNLTTSGTLLGFWNF